jgi:hypothetical protein
MPARPQAVEIDPELRRQLAGRLHNYAWTLLERPERSELESELMIDAAHASRLMWEEIGTPVNRARADWQCSRAYATLERPEPALHHAWRCLATCEEHGIEDFDLAYAYEALARAHAVAGEDELADAYEQRAAEAGRALANERDRELLFKDLATLR